MEGSNITITLAFAAGLASFLSPCVLPLVPGYISLISGVSMEGLKDGGVTRTATRRAVVLNSLAFNAGVSLIFVLLGATAGWIGNVLFSSPWVRIIGGLVIVAFGLQLMGVLKIGALYRDTRKFSEEKPRGSLGSLMLGMAFAAGWTPCIGPILGGIIGLAATSGGWKSGLVLSAFYSAGLAIPFLATGLLLNQFLGFYTWFRRHLHKVEVVSGVMLIVMGLMVASNSLTWVASYAAKYLPNAESLIQPGAGEQAKADGQGAQTPTANASFEPAPEVELKTLEGEPLRLADYRGRVVLLNFWATWCVPCRSEIPALGELNRDLQPRGFAVVGLSTSDSAELVKEFQKETPMDYTVALGDDDAASRYKVGVLPTTFVIDREGRIRHTIIGEKTRAYFEARIAPLLDETTAAAARQ